MSPHHCRSEYDFEPVYAILQEKTPGLTYQVFLNGQPHGSETVSRARAHNLATACEGRVWCILRKR